MAKFNPSIIDYLGKIDEGVLVLISIVYNQEYFEATFFYTQEHMVLTISEEMEQIIGHPIVEDTEYAELLKSILKRVIPYTEIYNRLDPVDFSKWSQLYEELPENQNEVEYLNEEQIKIQEEDQNKSSS